MASSATLAAVESVPEEGDTSSAIGSDSEPSDSPEKAVPSQSVQSDQKNIKNFFDVLNVRYYHKSIFYHFLIFSYKGFDRRVRF